MNLSIIVGAVVFLGSIILSQKLAVNASAKLDDQTKLKIAEVFPKRNVNYSMIVFGVVIIFLVALYLWPKYNFQISVIYAIAFCLYLIAKLILNVRKLAEIGAPDTYIHSIKTSFWVFIVGSISAVVIALVVNQVLPVNY
ncbi:MAG TPA: hypothetical protein PLP21_16490 [Pyrinomonadaceae bacterium]|nr:hypothetical protein [Acidobacteriota bacterium]HQZ97920.1 hypothetical protein [Pyrinomonadaceae bacterium]